MDNQLVVEFDSDFELFSDTTVSDSLRDGDDSSATSSESESSSSSSSSDSSYTSESGSSSSESSSDTIIPLIGMLAASVAAAIVRKRKRENEDVRLPRRTYRRLDWTQHWNDSINDPSFERDLRMKPSSFQKLVDMLKDSLYTDAKMASRRGGEVPPAVAVYLTIRYLAGAPYTDVMRFLGISPTTFYASLHKVLIAILQCKELDIKFPETEDECIALNHQFTAISKKNAIANCVGVVDGYLMCIEVPWKKEAKNVRGYYSGHYRCHGLNIQAVCDANCVFNYFAVTAPGSCNDRAASRQKICGRSLLDRIEELPEGYVVIGDAAYDATEHLIPMFYGANRHNQTYSNFKYAASQVRIRIEMSFGRMTAKWGILHRSIAAKLKTTTRIGLVIARLHNFCTKEMLVHGDSEWDRNSIKSYPYLEAVPNEQRRGPAFPIVRRDRSAGGSAMRFMMVDHVVKSGLERPTSSVLHQINLQQLETENN